MILRPLLSGLAFMGFVACAGAQTDDSAEAPAFTMEDVSASPDAWRAVDPENLVVIDTSKGKILIELMPSAAPNHVAQFKAYVRAGLYNNTPFHRVIKGFMAQGGDVGQVHGADKMMPQLEAEFTFRRDPNETAMDPVGYADAAVAGFHQGFPLESVAQFMSEMSVDGRVESWMPHCAGVLSSARTDDPNSANAQFFLISDQGRHLDKQYTAKGRVLSGMDVVTSIKLGPKPDGYPISNPDVVTKASMAADLDATSRPTVYVERTNTPEWAARLEAADKADTDICAITQPAAVVE